MSPEDFDDYMKALRKYYDEHDTSELMKKALAANDAQWEGFPEDIDEHSTS